VTIVIAISQAATGLPSVLLVYDRLSLRAGCIASMVGASGRLACRVLRLFQWILDRPPA